jgi:uncharacterized protein YjbI with pentapeptide repeats
MNKLSGRKKKNQTKVIEQLRKEISSLKRELEEEEKRNPSSLVKENTAYFRNAVEKEFSKFDWSGKKVDVRGGDFSGSDMRDINLENMIATDAVFKGTDLKGATFDGADLKGADFSGAEFDRFTSFRRAKIKGAIFDLKSLSLLSNIGLKGDFSYKVSYVDKGSVTVQSVAVFVKVLEGKFKNLLNRTKILVKDEEEALKVALQDTLIREHGSLEGTRLYKNMLGRGGSLNIESVKETSFDPNVDFNFGFKKRSKEIAREYRRLMLLEVPPSLISSASVFMFEIKNEIRDGILRESARSKSQSGGWKNYIPFWR